MSPVLLIVLVGFYLKLFALQITMHSTHRHGMACFRQTLYIDSLFAKYSKQIHITLCGVRTCVTTLVDVCTQQTKYEFLTLSKRMLVWARPLHICRWYFPCYLYISTNVIYNMRKKRTLTNWTKNTMISCTHKNHHAWMHDSRATQKTKSEKQ